MGLKLVKDNMQAWLDGIVKRESAQTAFLNGVIYPMYQKAQINRWKSENASEGANWLPLNPTYAAKKLEKFAEFKGQGTKMLVATNTLLDSVVGRRNEFHRKKVTRSTLMVGTAVPYAKHVSEERPFMDFDDRKGGTLHKMRRKWEKFIVEGKTK